MAQSPLFSADFKTEPYWWEDAPPPADGETAIPAQADVAVIGSGYTGLHAALQTARPAGTPWSSKRKRPATGAAAETAGRYPSATGPPTPSFAGSFGRELADRIHGEGFDAFDYLGDFIGREEIDCAWRRVGRFHGAHLPSSYEALAREIENEPRERPIEAYMVPRAEQREEIGSDVYHGGVVYPAARFAAPRALPPRNSREGAEAAGATGGHPVPGRGGGARRRRPSSCAPRAGRFARATWWWRPTAIPAP